MWTRNPSLNRDTRSRKTIGRQLPPPNFSMLPGELLCLMSDSFPHNMLVRKKSLLSVFRQDRTVCLLKKKFLFQLQITTKRTQQLEFVANVCRSHPVFRAFYIPFLSEKYTTFIDYNVYKTTRTKRSGQQSPDS